MKMYKVELRVVAVVVAEDEAEAYQVAQDFKRDIVADDDCQDITVVGEVACPGDLSDGWDQECIPYGGDGYARVAELFGA